MSGERHGVSDSHLRLAGLVPLDADGMVLAPHRETAASLFAEERAERLHGWKGGDAPAPSCRRIDAPQMRRIDAGHALDVGRIGATMMLHVGLRWMFTDRMPSSRRRQPRYAVQPADQWAPGDSTRIGSLAQWWRQHE